MARKRKGNLLLKRIIGLFAEERRGKVLDLGCAAGHYSIELHKLGFDVTSLDVTSGFKYRDQIRFIQHDGNGPFPFKDGEFDYILLAEVIEHIRAPHPFLKEIRRVLKANGALVLSTPNILSLKSRMRYLFEGSYEYFREPPLDHEQYNKKVGIDVSQIHVIPYRYHELEFLLYESGFSIKEIETSLYESRGLSILLPIIWFHLNSKARRSIKKGGIDYSRVNRVILKKEILFGRHLIIKANKMLA